MTTSPHPERLGKYQVTGVLGEGAMGVVYKGFDPGIQRIVALKTVRRQLLDSGDQGSQMVARFRNEAQAAGRLAHPGIVAVYDYGDEGEVAYIAMEYVEGNTLQRYIGSEVHFNDSDVVSVVVQLLDALEHAHQQGVWHRDIKPANILMTRNGRVKVADFGIARIESARLTQITSVIGTPTCMAPEQFQGLAIDRRVDIYSTGALLYQLLVGQPPFVGTPESLAYRVVHEAPVLPSAVPGCKRGSAYDGVLAVALAKRPEQRFPTAAAFRQALISVLDKPVSATVSDQTVVALPPRGARDAAGRAGPTSGISAPTLWEPSVLAQVEHTLARHVGPLAAVLVRRTARDCTDLPALLQRLAEQVTNPAARTAFLTQAARQTHGTGAGSLGSGAHPPSGHSLPGIHSSSQPHGAVQAHGGAPLPLTDEFVAQSARLLATYVGPIASVLSKRAAARAPGRDAYVSALLEAVTDAAKRERLRAELSRLH
jgi:predicted Ser/Thr protein kinase